MPQLKKILFLTCLLMIFCVENIFIAALSIKNINLACGGTITEETGTIVHPNYPGRYANRRDCRYAITVRPDKVVRLIFEKIDMENADICRYDYVEVEDSFNYETKRYCQNKQYEDFISSGRSIVINFRTDQAGVRSGFKILWMSTDPVTRVTTTTLRPVTTRGPTEEIIVNRGMS